LSAILTRRSPQIDIRPRPSAFVRLRRLAGSVARRVFTVLAVGLAAATVYEQVGAWRDAQVLRQVGRSVDIGGRALNLHCLGTGSPTVVFVSGRTAPGYVWTPTQRGVAAFTRACWYDRADIGWSDPGPDPAWADQASRDLRQLVEHAPLARPLVLVGHSYGGHVVRLYHDAHPEDTAGMVLVDAASEDAGTIQGMPHRQRPQLPRALIRGLSWTMGQLGMIRWRAADPGPPLKGWTAEEWQVLALLRRQRNMLLADAKVGPGRASDDLVRGAGGLEDLPLIVLTQGATASDSGAGPAVLSGWVALQRRLAERSRRGRQVLVPESGHAIPEEAPAAVVEAVRDVVTTVRGTTRAGA
jgi:pimeloyl-ACP methyl ester carboxylesterase